MKSMEITAVGIDVSKSKSTVAIRRPGGTNKWFRLGTSRLANQLLSEIEGEDVKFF